MNAREFFYAVAEMRRAQREYFRTRDQQTLRACRAMENAIDAEIERVKAIVAANDSC